MPYLILQHEPAEGPGRLRDGLPGSVRTIHTFAGEAIPDTLRDIDGILTLGGEMNVGDPLPWMPVELWGSWTPPRSAGTRSTTPAPIPCSMDSRSQ